MLAADRLSFASDGNELLAEASVTLAGGEVLAILGPNGAGKTTLLKLLARELVPTTGHVTLNGTALSKWNAIELARHRAVLPQAESLRFGFDVRQVVELGRYPWNAGRSPRENGIVDEAMRATGIARFASRSYLQLSAGERARVQLARVLAQVWEPSPGGARFLLLDEPTASLDLGHQHEVLTAVRRFARSGAGIAMVLHDLNLALRYADRALLMKDGRIDTSGPVRTTLSREPIERVFEVKVELLTSPHSGQPWIAPVPPAADSGERHQI